MNITLPAFIIADLYKDLLVLPEGTVMQAAQLNLQGTTKNEPEKKPGTQKTDKKIWLGDNKQNIAILVNDDAAAFINDEWLKILSKLLSACKLTLADVVIINYHQHNYSFTQLKKELQPQYIFMFDVSEQQLQLPFTVPHYQLQQYDGCAFLIAPAVTLSAIKDDASIKDEKRKLWDCLKKIFAA